MNESEAIQLAHEHNHAGKLEQAENVYREILNMQPNNDNLLIMRQKKRIFS